MGTFLISEHGGSFNFKYPSGPALEIDIEPNLIRVSSFKSDAQIDEFTPRRVVEFHGTFENNLDGTAHGTVTSASRHYYSHLALIGEGDLGETVAIGTGLNFDAALIFEAAGSDELSFNDIIYSGDDFLSYGQGVTDGHTLFYVSGAGDDTISGSGLIDKVFAGSGHDVAYGFNGDDSLAGEDGDDLLVGGRGDDTLEGGAGNDTIDLGSGSDLAQGGTGNDTIVGDFELSSDFVDTAIFDGDSASYTLSIDRLGLFEIAIEDRVDHRDGTDHLTQVQRLKFADMSFDADTLIFLPILDEETVDPLVELYIAYFGRAPDALGLYYWGAQRWYDLNSSFFQIDGSSLNEISAFFEKSAEAQALFPFDGDNFAFLTSVYQNVLGRDPDAAGIAFWQPLLDDQTVTKSSFILSVLEGVRSENTDNLDQDSLLQRAKGAEYLDAKTAIGKYFAIAKGMSDTENARSLMSAFDGTESGLIAAKGLADQYYSDALDPLEGEFLVQITGYTQEEADSLFL